MELQNIHIQVSIDGDEVACKEEDFSVLSKVTTYCLAWKNEILEEENLEAQLVNVIRTYREHNNLDHSHPVEVGVWFTTPQPDAVEIQWEPLLNTQPDLRVIQGGKDD